MFGPLCIWGPRQPPGKHSALGGSPASSRSSGPAGYDSSRANLCRGASAQREDGEVGVRIKAASLLGVVVLLSTPPTTSASTDTQRPAAECARSTATDPADAEIALDVAEIYYGTKGRGKNKLLVACVRMHEEWINAQLHGGGILFYFNEIGKPHCNPGRCSGNWEVSITSRALVGVRGYMIEQDDSEEAADHDLPAWRVDSYTVAVGIPRRILHPETHAYSYVYLTSYSTAFHFCAQGHQDRCVDEVPFYFRIPRR